MGETSKFKRITQNTILLFLRISVLTFVNLYAVRLLLRGLGACDYGIYNAVAGVVTLSSCLIPVFSQAIQRFYSYLSGSGSGDDKLRMVFSASVNIIVCLCVLLFFAFETVGLWVLNTYMTIPSDRVLAANTVFHFAVFSFFFTLLQIPYAAAVYAHEQMGVYAMVSCIDSVLKLLAAFLIGLTAIDNLAFYSLCLAVIAFIDFVIYWVYCRREYAECRYVIVRKAAEYKGLLSFTGWSMLGSMAGVGLMQGSAILLNMFFGPLTNAAFAIATTIYNAFLSLGNSIILAFRAPMIKAYAACDGQSLDTMFGMSNKCIFYLLSTVAIPVFVCMRQILTLWIGNPTLETVTFSRLILVYTVVIAMSAPITTIIQATGAVKYYYICCDSMTLMHLPIAYVMLKFGLPSEFVLVSMLGVIIAAHVIRMVLLNRCYAHFSVRGYLTSLLVRGGLFVILGYMVARALLTVIEPGVKGLVLLFLVSSLVNMAIFVMLGINSNERAQIVRMVAKCVRRGN